MYCRGTVLALSRRTLSCTLFLLLGASVIVPWMLGRTASAFVVVRRQLRPVRGVSQFFMSSKNQGDNTDNLSKWEKMYYEGEKREQEQLESSKPIPRSAVRVVTFDLDNTLWRTSPTISAANDALAEFLDFSNVKQPARVEKVMGELFQASKPRYCPMLQEVGDNRQQEQQQDTSTAAKAPVLLTLLRKDAIQYVLEEHNGYTPEKSVELAEKAFDVWTRARHDAIPNHLATSVEACLAKLKKNLIGSSGHTVLIGAITDGNSSPESVEGLGQYFDFCINAETVGVAKPDNRVYTQAMTKVGQYEQLADLFGPTFQTDDNPKPEILQDIVGPWWVHVGDDFVKDVVAAKSLNMRSIWSRELVQTTPKETKTQSANDNDEAPSKTVEEFVKRISEMKVVKMEIGAGDFLEDSIRSEFADAIIDNFEEVSDILLRWHEEGLDYSKDETATEELVNAKSNEDQLPVSSDDSTMVSLEPAPPQPAEKVSDTSPDETKFCVYCGTKLPKVAKFCLACGEKQPQL